jgi:hypothetical protein
VEQSAEEFADLARRYRRLCDTGHREDAEADVRALLALLCELCAAAVRLPSAEPSDRPDVDRGPHPTDIIRFEPNHYRECFNPFELEAEPVIGSLLDDLGDIYVDLRQGLDTLDRGTPEQASDAVWNWKFSFESHWGEHATGAIRALYWLLRS